MQRSSPAFLILRLAIYAALVAGTYEWMVLAASSRGAEWLVRDDGPVEITQFLASLATGNLFLLLSRERLRFAELFRFFAALSLIACARELDNLTLELGSRDAYKLIALPPLVWAVWILVRSRELLFEQLAVFSRTPGFSLLLAGFLVVTVYSQILGQKELWLAMLDADTYRPVKNLVEESSELLGYLLMLFGATETAADDSGG